MNISNKEKSPRSQAGSRAVVAGTNALYALVVLEFFYMASPFAAYFYSIYGPGLDFLGNSEATAWATRFVLPHIVSQTTSSLVNCHTFIGVALLAIGVIGFCFGAYRIYRSKLTNRTIIMTGLYRHIRHPQYLFLIIASFGTLLIWPRMLAVVGFALVLALYIALSRSEERQCESIDPDYRIYRDRTGAFLPRSLEWPFRRADASLRALPRLLYWPFVSFICFTIMITGSYFIKIWSTNQIQGVYTSSMATISIGNEPITKIKNVQDLALGSPLTSKFLSRLQSEKALFINYVLPSDMYVSEVPMNLGADVRTTHRYVNDPTRARFKIIFTVANLADGDRAEGIDILRKAINKYPVVEVWVNLQTQRVEKVLVPPTNQFYNGIPVPVY